MNYTQKRNQIDRLPDRRNNLLQTKSDWTS